MTLELRHLELQSTFLSNPGVSVMSGAHTLVAPYLQVMSCSAIEQESGTKVGSGCT